jgi:glutathione peroxidase
MIKRITYLFLIAILAFTACKESHQATTTQNTMATETNQNKAANDFYAFKMETLEGKEVDFSVYKGKKVLLVNTASECGYTPQYADLQQLHEKYGDKVVVLGFPANNFGAQEPGTHEDIAAFCEKNYGVNFPVFEKISVIGDDTHPLYQWLAQNAPNNEKPNWNFCKYLVNENGQVVAFFPSKAEPMGEEILLAIQE